MLMSIPLWFECVCVSSVILSRTGFGGAINIMTDFTLDCHWLAEKDA